MKRRLSPRRRDAIEHRLSTAQDRWENRQHELEDKYAGLAVVAPVAATEDPGGRMSRVADFLGDSSLEALVEMGARLLYPAARAAVELVLEILAGLIGGLLEGL